MGRLATRDMITVMTMSEVEHVDVSGVIELKQTSGKWGPTN